MNKIFVVIISALLCQLAGAQFTLKGVELNGMIGFTVGNYKKVALVFPYRDGDVAFQAQSHIPLMLRFGGIKKSWSFYAGVGYFGNLKSIQRKNQNAQLFPFRARPDTTYIRKVRLHSNYLSIPLGIDYKISNGVTSRTTVHIRALIVPAFNLTTTSKATFDSAIRMPSMQEKKEVEAAYAGVPVSFALSVIPEIILRHRIFKKHKGGIQAGLSPVSFDIISPNRQLIINRYAFRTSVGYYFNWK